MGGFMPPDPMKRALPRTPGMMANQPGGAGQVPYANRAVAQPGTATGTVGRPSSLSGAASSFSGAVSNPTPTAASPATPAPTTQATSSGGFQYYGRSGGTSADSPNGTLEAGIRDYITRGLSGATSQGFIDRAKSQLGAATEAQRAGAARQIDSDAIRRGGSMFHSSIPAEATAAAGRAANSNYVSGLTNILQGAEQQDQAARDSAAQMSMGLLGANRQMDSATQSREDAARAAAAAEAGHSFTYVDPDTGQSYQMDDRWF